MFLSAIMNEDFDNFDMIEYVKLKREEREKINKEIEEVMLLQKKTKYRPRKIYLKKNPRMSNWWTDYVLDERGTFRDPDHPNARLFAYRFSFSFEAVKELIAKVKESGEHFWKRNMMLLEESRRQSNY
jgi:hypothetical protein